MSLGYTFLVYPIFILWLNKIAKLFDIFDTKYNLLVGRQQNVFSYCTNYEAAMPDIVVYMNCDTRLAINLEMFNLGDNDEFIFAIKNYSYIDSPYVFLFRARKSDIDENTGEVIFAIPPTASKHLKPGAFYNFSVLLNAFDKRKPTEYKKLTDNGNIILEYGAQDMIVRGEGVDPDSEIIDVHLEPTDDTSEPTANLFMGSIVKVDLEECK
jgi:hypothetical protein